MTASLATIGDNNPPTESELLQQQIAQRQATILAGATSLLESAARAPKDCTDDETAKKITQLVKLMTASSKALDNARTTEKAPHLAAGRTVDDFFKERIASVDTAKAAVMKPLNLYTQKKDADIRAEQIAEAKRLQEIAAEELKDAANSESAGSVYADANLQQALLTEQAAEKTMVAATGHTALGKVVSAGGTAGIRKEWKATAYDRATLSLEELRAYLPDAAIQQALNGFVRNGGRTLRGATIEEVITTVVR